MNGNHHGSKKSSTSTSTTMLNQKHLQQPQHQHQHQRQQSQQHQLQSNLKYAEAVNFVRITIDRNNEMLWPCVVFENKHELRLALADLVKTVGHGTAVSKSLVKELAAEEFDVEPEEDEEEDDDVEVEDAAEEVEANRSNNNEVVFEMENGVALKTSPEESSSSKKAARRSTISTKEDNNNDDDNNNTNTNNKGSSNKMDNDDEAAASKEESKQESIQSDDKTITNQKKGDKDLSPPKIQHQLLLPGAAKASASTTKRNSSTSSNSRNRPAQQQQQQQPSTLSTNKRRRGSSSGVQRRKRKSNSSLLHSSRRYNQNYAAYLLGEEIPCLNRLIDCPVNMPTFQSQYSQAVTLQTRLIKKIPAFKDALNEALKLTLGPEFSKSRLRFSIIQQQHHHLPTEENYEAISNGNKRNGKSPRGMSNVLGDPISTITDDGPVVTSTNLSWPCILFDDYHVFSQGLKARGLFPDQKAELSFAREYIEVVESGNSPPYVYYFGKKPEGKLLGGIEYAPMVADALMQQYDNVDFWNALHQAMRAIRQPPLGHNKHNKYSKLQLEFASPIAQPSSSVAATTPGSKPNSSRLETNGTSSPSPADSTRVAAAALEKVKNGTTPGATSKGSASNSVLIASNKRSSKSGVGEEFRGSISKRYSTPAAAEVATADAAMETDESSASSRFASPSPTRRIHEDDEDDDDDDEDDDDDDDDEEAMETLAHLQQQHQHRSHHNVASELHHGLSRSHLNPAAASNGLGGGSSLSVLSGLAAATADAHSPRPGAEAAAAAAAANANSFNAAAMAARRLLLQEEQQRLQQQQHSYHHHAAAAAAELRSLRYLELAQQQQLPHHAAAAAHLGLGTSLRPSAAAAAAAAAVSGGRSASAVQSEQAALIQSLLRNVNGPGRNI